jgi:hypothetical protein
VTVTRLRLLTGGNGNLGGLSATGGTATSTGGTIQIGGAPNSGGSGVTGGMSAQTGGGSTSGGTSSTGGSSDTGGTGVTVPLVGACAAPCSASLQTNAEYTSLQAINGATLFYDSTTGQLTLRNNPDQAASTATPLLIFTYSSTEGYSVWTHGNVWFAFTENYDYSTDYAGYSLQLNHVVTADMVDATTGQMYIIKFSLQVNSVAIAEARLASCNATQGTTCQNATDCPNVTSGQIPSLSSACAACYTAFNACSATYCATDCPGQGGNACMMCQTDNGCHTDFMQCSGLDYMPRGTLTLPVAS